jgi:hypothetical protein
MTALSDIEWSLAIRISGLLSASASPKASGNDPHKLIDEADVLFKLLREEFAKNMTGSPKS